MINVEQAKLHPSSIFKHPHDVVISQELTLTQKVEILKQWAYDERELEIAEEENMSEQNSENHLQEVSDALLELGVEVDR